MNGGTIKTAAHPVSQTMAVRKAPSPLLPQNCTVLARVWVRLIKCVRENETVLVLACSSMSSADEQSGEAYRHLKPKMSFLVKGPGFYKLRAINVLGLDTNRMSHNPIPFESYLGKHSESSCRFFVHCQ